MKDYKVSKAVFSDDFRKEIYDVVALIPTGKVISYGEIAALLGKPQCSRMVGRALKEIPKELNLPCHRVVNAQGRLVPGWEEQQQLLLSEGVCFKESGNVDLSRFRWNYRE